MVVDERTLMECGCVKVTPLVHNPGRLLLTDRQVYFQALNNVEVRWFPKKTDTLLSRFTAFVDLRRTLCKNTL